MKNMKKIFGLVLCLMTGMLCMANVDAKDIHVGTDEDVEGTAIVVVKEPVFGDTVNDDYTIGRFYLRKNLGGSNWVKVQGTGSQVNQIAITWYDSEGNELEAGDKFERGVYHPVFGTYLDNGLNPNDTYYIDDEAQLIVNPVYVGRYYAEQNHTFNFKNTNEISVNVITAVITSTDYEKVAAKDLKYTVYEPVDELDLTVAEPVNNEKPVKTATLESKVLGAVKVTEVPIQWYVSGDAIVYSVEPMGENDVFEYGKYYTYVVEEGFDLSTTLNDYFKLTDEYKVLFNGVENCAFGPIPHTYKFMDNSDKQTATIGKLTKYTFRVDAEMGELEEVKIGDLVLVPEEDYTETAGSIIVDLTKKGLEKVNKLKAGTYQVNVKFYGLDNKTVGTLTLNNPNPETSDNILLYVTVSMISLSAMAVVFLRRKSYN